MLHLHNLSVKVDQKPVLKQFNLHIPSGELHVLMGPNGSGKSTLANVIAGCPGYEITGGDILFQGESLLEKNPTERSQLGIFMAFQDPVEVPGLTNLTFLRTIVNAHRTHNPMDAIEFMAWARDKAQKLGLSEHLLYRHLNEGFSGGEKKRNEMLQMVLLEPQLCILDEIDSGLDVDALHQVAHAINSMRNSTRSFLIITHYQRLLELLQADKIHILHQGQIARSGGYELAQTLHTVGYQWLVQETP